MTTGEIIALCVGIVAVLGWVTPMLRRWRGEGIEVNAELKVLATAFTSLSDGIAEIKTTLKDQGESMQECQRNHGQRLVRCETKLGIESNGG